MIRALAALAALSIPASAYVRLVNNSGAVTIRTDNANIQFYLNQNFVPGFTNNDGALIVTPDTDVMGALNGAIAAWNNIPGASVQFLPIQSTTLVNDPTDGMDVIVMADTPAIRSALGPALAATTRVASSSNTGLIGDTDILFNPVLTFSSTNAPKTYDLQAVFTATLGYALGATYSPIIASPLSTFGVVNEPFRQVLTPDDLAFAAGVYPDGSATYGTLTGTLTLNGAPLRNALITAVDASGSGVVISTLTSPKDGTWSVAAPPAAYLVYAQPVIASQNLPQGLPSDAILPSYLGLVLGLNPIDSNFDPSFLGGNGSAATVTVTGGASTDASFSPAPANTTTVVTLLDFAALPIGADVNTSIGKPKATQLTAGQSYDIIMQGLALDASLTESDIQIFGPVTLRSGTLKVSDPTLLVNNVPFQFARFTVDVAPVTAQTPATLIVSNNGGFTTYSGGMVVLPSH